MTTEFVHLTFGSNESIGSMLVTVAAAAFCVGEAEAAGETRLSATDDSRNLAVDT